MGRLVSRCIEGAPGGECVSPPRLELLGAGTPMGPDKDSPVRPKNQATEAGWEAGGVGGGLAVPGA